MLLRRVAFPDFCEPCLPQPSRKAARRIARAALISTRLHRGVLEAVVAGFRRTLPAMLARQPSM
jgi:hypothetical protein